MSFWYSICKSLHLIGAVSWMAGLFYLVRIMVYHALATERPEAERDILARQYTLMEWKAYKIILRPAVVITWTFGTIMLCINPAFLEQGWMHFKLLFLLLLTGYTHWCKSQIRHLEAGTSRFGHLHFRAFNEVPTIFLAGIVFLAVFKTGINYAGLLGGLAAFTGLIAWGIHKANR